MKKMNKRGKRILVMVLVFAILCTSLPCTPTIPVHAAQTGKNGSWYEVNSRINTFWEGHITGEITVTNVSSQTRQDWQIAFPWQAKISSMWNGRYEETEGGYLITPMEYNAELAPEASVSVGFMAEGEDSELNRLTEEGFFQEAGASITDAEEREKVTPVPSVDVTASQAEEATASPTGDVTASPTGDVTASPTEEPTVSPASEPTPVASVAPNGGMVTAVLSMAPTADLTTEPTEGPTVEPTISPTVESTVSPSVEPTVSPTTEPMVGPTVEPTISPTVNPATEPIADPMVSPTMEPTASPTIEPIVGPAIEPTASPTTEAMVGPTAVPTAEPATESMVGPTEEPTAVPDAEPTEEPAEDLYIYTDTTISEDLVCGNLFLMGGRLECYGHSITVQKDYFQNSGNCSLNYTQLTVGGNVSVIAGDLSLYQCSLNIGGKLSVQKGSICFGSSEAVDIQGDLSLDGEGKLDLSAYNSAPKISVHGDFIINSTKQTYLQKGSLDLRGDLIQEDSGYADSLRVSDSFCIRFTGVAIQKIRLANPDISLGTLDFRESKGIDLPEEIHARTLYGFRKIQEKELQKFYLSNVSLSEDDTVYGRKIQWYGEYLNTGGNTLHFAGDVRIAVSELLDTAWGGLSVQGNLSVAEGTFRLARQSSTEIQGDLRMEGSGKLNMTEYLDLAQLTIHGDLLIDSTRQSVLQYGNFILGGDLIQKDSGYADSLRVSDSFCIRFTGVAIQKIRLANPDISLGTLDFRESKGIDLPEEIHARTLYGFRKIQEKESQKFYLSNVSLSEDDTVNVRKVWWYGDYLNTGAHTLHFAGDVRMAVS